MSCCALMCLSVHLNVACARVCQCLNADGGRKAGENCSKLTYIKGPLGLCSTASAAGDILN